MIDKFYNSFFFGVAVMAINMVLVGVILFILPTISPDLATLQVRVLILLITPFVSGIITHIFLKDSEFWSDGKNQ